MTSSTRQPSPGSADTTATHATREDDRSSPASDSSGRGSTGSNSPLETSHGKTTIADTVVTKIASRAAQDVSGVYQLGGGAARAFGAIAERIPGGRSNTDTRGVSVEVGDRQAAVDLTMVVEYGGSIAELARGVRRSVIGAIEQMTGLEVVEVNIEVTELHLPDDDRNRDQGGDGEDRHNRVQ